MQRICFPEILINVATKKSPAKKKEVKKTSQNQWISYSLVVIVVIITGLFVLKSYKINIVSSPKPSVSKNPNLFNFGGQKIMLNNRTLTFVDGVYTNSDPTLGENGAIIANRSVDPSGTRAAAILIDSPGGSGTFYYLVGASLINGKEVYSTPVLLGDRIKMQSLTVDNPQAQDNGLITVEYLDHSADEALADEPTVKITKKFAFENSGNLTPILH